MEESNFDEYDKFPPGFWYIHSRRDLLERLLSEQKAGKILDLGCGTGFNYETLEKHGEVFNLDIDSRALKSCEEKGITNLYCADATKTPFDDSTFDVVVAIELLEHIQDDEGAVEEIRRILKPGGRLVFTVPANEKLWSSDDELAHHQRRYTKESIQKLLGKNFTKKYLGYRYFFIYLPSIAVFKFQKAQSKKKGKQVNSLTMTPRPLNFLLRSVMSFENLLISKGVRFPFGIGLVGVYQNRRKIH